MVLESLTNPYLAIKRPYTLILIGILYATIALFLSYWVFEDYSSLTTVFLITAAAIPLMYKAIVSEEEKDLQDLQEVFLLKEHGKTLSYFLYLFLGVTIGLTFWYVVLPGSMVTTLFSAQAATYNSINSPVTGQVIGESYTRFNQIFSNNLKVLAFCLLFSFLYGTGAIFILMWNASVIALAIGNYIRTNIASLASSVGGASAYHYFEAISYGLFRYSLHGIPEIAGYFVAGLAGGIISIAIIRHDFTTFKFERVLLDSADLVMISLGLMFVAAVIEVWVTPFIF